MSLRKTLVTILLTFTVLSPLVASAAQDFDRTPSSAEVIDAVGRVTGLTNDTLSLLMKESPELFGNLNDTVTAVKVVNMLFNAEDTQALTEIFNWQMGNFMDSMLNKLYPQNMLFFISAVKYYKSSLELVRDVAFVPSLQETIYQRYKSVRGGRADYVHDPRAAYLHATGSGKYFPAKQKMYDELVKTKDYKAALIDKKMEKLLWAEIDDFWRNQLEARYQRELATKKKAELIEHIWAQRKAELAAIINAAKYTSLKLTIVDAQSLESLNGVAVKLVGPQQADGYSSGGRVEVINIKPGSYDISLQKEGYEPIVRKGKVLKGGQTLTAKLKMNPLANTTLALQVRDAKEGFGISGAAVRLNGPVNKSGSADSNGRVKIEGLYAGTYNVEISATGYQTLAGEIPFAAGQTISKSVSLEPLTEAKQEKKIVKAKKTRDPEACYAPIGKKIAELRTHNQSQDPTRGGVSTLSYGQYAECSKRAGECFNKAKEVYRICPPDKDGTYASCGVAQSRSFISCAQEELSCSEAKARAACGM